jgi:hypothetical protein
MVFHDISNIITIIEKVNPHPLQKRGIIEMMLILNDGIFISKEILVSRLEEMGRIRGQLIKKRHEVFEANGLSRSRS